MSDTLPVLQVSGFTGSSEMVPSVQGERESRAGNPAQLYLLSLGTEQSRYRIARILDSVARSFGFKDLSCASWSNLRAEDIVLIKAVMEKEEKSPATINLVISALKGVARQAWILGQISDHDSYVIQMLKGSKGRRDSAAEGRALRQEDTHKLLVACGESPKGIRDQLILALGIGSGLRRTEIASLKLKDIDEKAGRIKIIGKGNKQRIIYPSRETWGLIRKWIALRGTDGCRELICAVRKGGNIDPFTSVTGNSIYQMLRTLSLQTDVGMFRPHDLRRTFATRMFEAGADINVVRQAMGHASISTTQRYDKRDQSVIERFASRIKV